MNVQIENIAEFLNSLHDYILEDFGLVPRDFETKIFLGSTSIAWSKRTNKLYPYDCDKFNSHLHIHSFDNCAELDELVVCCNEPDIIALQYVHMSIFGPQKGGIIQSLHSWLPAVTFRYCKIFILPNRGIDDSFNQNTGLIINSYFDPSYLSTLLNQSECAPHFSQITYNYYYNSNIVNCYNNYNVTNPKTNLLIMVRTRRRSRSRSSSPAGGSRRRSRSPSGSSRRRSRSPTASKPRKVSSGRRPRRRSSGGRRRSMSRS